MSNLQNIFGIDLGTTYSCISYVDEYKKPVIINNFENERTTPSIVFFDDDEVVVGNTAKSQSSAFPGQAVYMIKRSMGDENYIFQHKDSTYRPEEISAYILKKLVNDTKKTKGIEVKDVVITVPAYFGINEREATKKAGELANLNVRTLINEPTAAAISYGIEKSEKDQVFLVYDLGGGTFDITMLETKEKEIKVICTGGDHKLGGKDWDNEVVNYIASQIEKETGDSLDNVLDNKETEIDLNIKAEEIKKTLTTKEKALFSFNHEGIKIKGKIDRDDFYSLTEHLLERTISLTKDMLKDASEKGYNSFDKILLVGGSTRMPQVFDKLKEEFSVEIEFHDPDESVAHGAALFGYKIALDDEVKKKIKENSEKDYNNLDAVPTDEKEKAEEEVSKEQGMSLSEVKSRTETKIINVTSKGFGVVAESKDDEKKYVVNLISRNDPVPVDRKRSFGTEKNNQETASVIIMEHKSSKDGEYIDLEMCTEIGNAVLNLPSGLKEDSPIEISFSLAEDGRLIVKAVEKNEGKNVEIIVETQSVMKEKEFQDAKKRVDSITVS